MARRRSPRIDRRVANAHILRLKLTLFRNSAQRDTATEDLHLILRDALLTTAVIQMGAGHGEQLAEDAADVAIDGVFACRLRYVSRPMDDILFRRVRRRTPHQLALGAADGLPPQPEAEVMQEWGPEWLSTFRHLLYLTRHCWAAIRAFFARDHACGWKGRLSQILHGKDRNPVMTRDLKGMIALVGEIAVIWEALDPHAPPVDPVAALIWELDAVFGRPQPTASPSISPHQIVVETQSRLPRTSGQFPVLSDSLGRLHAAIQGQGQAAVAAAALAEFLNDVGTLPTAPPPPGSSLIDWLTRLGPNHPTLTDPPETLPAMSWPLLRTASPAQAAVSAQAPAAPLPPLSRQLLLCLSQEYDPTQPKAFLLALLHRSWDSHWLRDLYRWADAIFLYLPPLAVPAQDLADAEGRIRDWEQYLTRCLTANPPPAFASVEIPPAARHPDNLDRALSLLQSWTATPGSPPPAYWSAVPEAEREVIRGALISLYLEDLGRDLDDCLE